MPIIKSFYFPDTPENRRLIDQLVRLSNNTGESCSEIVRKAIENHVEKETRVVQSRIDAFKHPLEEKLDSLHSEFVAPNPKGYGTWDECLRREGLLCEQAISYSLDKGWRLTH